ncbi:uncharacterized protein ARMOST_19761 [Armillaria ostoyae]|uniref:Uncharacterized protein n=1 Tax=Armillaria ostoyae TaxID=47428 RepID=A0A284S5F7_ARMOS|nr:uncharacterized protein ARMOST_19761 [Armillaria ostoyae]
MILFNTHISWIAESWSYTEQIPNVNHQIDKGEDLFIIWTLFWADNVSGARSKQYQKHINVYMMNANLPGQLLQQEYFVQFVSTSQNAGALEQLRVVTNQVSATHVEPMQTYNAVTWCPCGFRLCIPDLPADNPQQAKEASHIGHQGNCKCHECIVGGENGFRVMLDSYYEFYEAGKPCNVEEIKACVLEQIRLATFGVESKVEALQMKTGTKDKIAQHWIALLIPCAHQLQAASPQRLHNEISVELLDWLGSQTSQPCNPLLDVEFLDPSQDTLAEILHTILLGIEKYAWHDLHSSWTLAQQEIFSKCLQVTNTDGLKIPPIRAEYMLQYHNGLIGKHFKTLIQTTSFHIHDLVSSDQFTLARTLGELAAVLWIPSIPNLLEYLDDLEVLIGNVLDAFANINPSKILIKIKLHVLVHLPKHIRHRGPAVCFSTEVYECFNAVFRMCSVLSNHQASSHDIAYKFVNLDQVKHVMSSGYWLQDSQWVTAGCDVHNLLFENPVLQRHLGWVSPSKAVPGLIKGPPRNKRTPLSAEGTLVLQCKNPMSLVWSGTDQ